MMQNRVLTQKAIEIIDKKLAGRRLTQQDSNYLSRFVRPKLRDIALINAEYLLKKLEYSQKGLSIEKKIEKIISENTSEIEAIIICGSAIQTNYEEYGDIDIIVAVKKVISLKQKEKVIAKIKEEGGRGGLNLDVQIYAKESIVKQYAYNPSLIYQLKDSKVIYGKLKIPEKIGLSNIDLKMKLDWSEGLSINSDGGEIYLALRNAMMVSLLMNKKIDNMLLKENLINLFGVDLLKKLKENKETEIEKRMVLNCLNSMVEYLEKELGNGKE
ncbi:MAG: hypothetical protein Q7S27_01815 [Nanoarchaeota archaeon]|nr:hypothetical protein [Nanoarchaeota archaeon]